MSTTSKNNTQRKSELRNREIYAAVKIDLRPQKSVALQYGLSQPRISQIVKQVSDRLEEFVPGEELELVFADAGRMRRLDWECQQRRIEQYRRCDLVFEASRQATVEQQWTYDGPAQGNEPVKTVVKERSGKLSLEAVKEQRRLNNELQWGGRRPPGVPKQNPGTAGQAGNGMPAKLPMPACLKETDRAAWDKLPYEVQDLAARRLAVWPEIPLECATAPEGERYNCYPWRTEAESNSAAAASLVIDGIKTIEEYIMQLEHTELSKPLAHPNVLTKDRDGKWTYIYPEQLPLPVMPPERAAYPEESPERIYWPYKSKAEHYAMMRAEMVVRGHLSREQYERLNAWASWFTGDKYPDPLAKMAQNISAGNVAFRSAKGRPLAEREATVEAGEARVSSKRSEPPRQDGGTERRSDGEPGWTAAALDAPRRQDEKHGIEYPVLSTEYPVLSPDPPAAGTAVDPVTPQSTPGPSRREGPTIETAQSRFLTPSGTSGGEDVRPTNEASGAAARGGAGPSRREGPTLPTRLERRLASGRRMTDRERRRLAGRLARSRETAAASEAGPSEG